MNPPRPIAVSLALGLWFCLACGGLAQDGAASRSGGESGARVDPASLAGFALAPVVDGAWVQGEPVDVPTDPHVVVLEAWATWCGPCREQMPHLAHIQADHADTVRVVAISDEARAKVERFVRDNEAMRSLTVVADGEGTWDRYEAIGPMQGIPHAWLVQGGRVVWYGHPGGLDPVLEAVLAGSWTPENAALAAELPALQERYLTFARAGSTEEAAAIGATFRDNPVVGATARNNLSWAILTELPEERRDLALALALAERAVEETEREDWAHLDTLALARWEIGDHAGALDDQEEAVRKCHDDAAGCDDLEERLDRFRSG